MAVSYAVNWNRIIWYFIPRACDITSNEWILGQQFPNERLNELFILQSNKQGFTEIAITFGERGTCHSIGNGRDRTQSRVLLSTSSLHTAENLLWLSQLLPFFSIKNEKKNWESYLPHATFPGNLAPHCAIYVGSEVFLCTANSLKCWLYGVGSEYFVV